MRFVLFVLLLIHIHLVFGEKPWQQKVDYTIHGRLNDQNHSFTAEMKITYHNNSSIGLNKIMIHTWMNAFGHHTSPYAQQLNNLGSDLKLTLSREDEGGYKALQFSMDDHVLQYHFIDSSHEILELLLAGICPPGEQITIHVSYQLDIPKNISRGGHLGQSYQMTQWYPKVALFDSSGWHTMPYLELGEFFNEFGDYKVTLDVPSNYIVASTGQLMNPSEIMFLNAYADSCLTSGVKDNPFSNLMLMKQSDQFKSLDFTASQVIDFAWFADKTFVVNRKVIPIGNATIEAWAYYHQRKITAWPQATTFAEHALKYFIESVGPYPYPQVSLVECDRDGSDAMEYPMITLIDRNYNTPPELEKVIVHEVGHNWFQAILASDERTNAWMDEGLVTYYEHRYANQKNINFSQPLTPWTVNSDYDKINDFTWYIHAARNRDAASTNESTTYTTRGYIESIYEKPAKGLELMARTLGQIKFDSLMKSYYDYWKFRHPGAKDLLGLFEADHMDWYEPLYLTDQKKVNVKIASEAIKSGIRISHTSPISLPVEVAGYRRDKKNYTQVHYTLGKGIEPFNIQNDSIQYFIADPDFLLPEISRKDNIARISSTAYVPKKNQLHLLPGIGHSLINDYYLSPFLSNNHYDGLILGLALHNLTLPSNALQFAGLAGYGLHSHKPVLLAGIEYSKSNESSVLDRWALGLEIRNFSSNESIGLNYFDRYLKLAPKMKFVLKPATQYAPQKEISFRTILLKLYHTDPLVDPNHPLIKSYSIHELKYDLFNDKTLKPFSFNITAEYGLGFGKIFTSLLKTFPYRFEHRKSGEIRFFTGILSQRSNAKIDASFQPNGKTRAGIYQNDYKYDELLLGRNETTNSLSQQIFEKDGGLYSIARWLPSDTWMLAASYRSMLPGPLPVRPYLQFVLAPRKTDHKVQLISSAGISLIFIKNILEVNFPVFESKNLPSAIQYESHNSYLKRCTFLLNLKALSPFKWIDRVSS